MRPSFACSSCGSASFNPPGEISDEALLRCSFCDGSLGSWGELKARASRLIAATGRDRAVSCDPLSLPGLGSASREARG
jgi:hypothetical protein